jgi:hypothetical protein
VTSSSQSTSALHRRKRRTDDHNNLWLEAFTKRLSGTRRIVTVEGERNEIRMVEETKKSVLDGAYRDLARRLDEEEPLSLSQLLDRAACLASTHFLGNKETLDFQALFLIVDRAGARFVRPVLVGNSDEAWAEIRAVFDSICEIDKVAFALVAMSSAYAQTTSLDAKLSSNHPDERDTMTGMACTRTDTTVAGWVLQRDRDGTIIGLELRGRFSC